MAYVELYLSRRSSRNVRELTGTCASEKKKQQVSLAAGFGLFVAYWWYLSCRGARACCSSVFNVLHYATLFSPRSPMQLPCSGNAVQESTLDRCFVHLTAILSGTATQKRKRQNNRRKQIFLGQTLQIFGCKFEKSAKNEIWRGLLCRSASPAHSYDCLVPNSLQGGRVVQSCCL